MSTCLVSIGNSGSFTHEASRVLAREFGLDLCRTVVPEDELCQVTRSLRPDDLGGANALANLLDSHGFNLERLSRDFACWVVLSEYVVPVDLLTIRGRDVGRCVSISHVAGSDLAELMGRGRMGLTAERHHLRRVAFLPITELPDNFPRRDQDLVKSALKLSDTVGVDLLVRPDAHLSLEQFGRRDLQVLHIDSHADLTGIQLAADAERMSTLEDIPRAVPIPLVLLVACSTARGRDSLCNGLLRRGALAAVGAFFDWATGAFTDDITTPDVYDAFYGALLAGQTVGRAFSLAKQRMVTSVSNAGQLLLGNQFLSFQV